MMMKIHLFLLLTFCVLAKCSLLEMSQFLWARLLAGGLAKGNLLDPLRVPVIKVDQSEGNTSYKVVLRNVEIKGLNLSTLESVHIARGRLKLNLSDSEAGYVSYSDLREMDSIRYRFHTLVKEPKPRNDTNSSEYFNHLSNLSKVQPMESRYREAEVPRNNVTNRNQPYRYSGNSELNSRDDPVDVVYAENYKRIEIPNPSDQRKQNFSTPREKPRENIGEIKCSGSCIRHGNPSTSFSANGKNVDTERFGGDRKYTEFREREDGPERFELKQTFPGVPEPGQKIISSPESRNNEKFVSGSFVNSRLREAAVESGAYQRQVEAEKPRNSSSYESAKSEENYSRINYKMPPGYVDIVYANNDDQKIKHFAGFRRREDKNMEVYGLEDIKKDLVLQHRYVIHNFTETEAIRKRNNMTRAAYESKRIKDLVRYAENYQEKDGYFQQGMQMIYHFGEMEDVNPDKTLETPELNEAKRRKREHMKDDDDDIMHVIMRLRVPLLQVKADYLLTGKVGREILRGNGLLTGNFTGLIGDFTLELKRVNSTTMIVRAARARLVADDRKVTLQGMREKGPVESILIHGLMAAEAVAAMIVDDLATKVLSENPPTDAMIYKMYSNDPGL